MQGFEQLRERFIRNSIQRIEEMDADLGRAAVDAAALESLRRNFHGMAGLGTTYGFPRVSSLGHEGEVLLRPATSKEGRPFSELHDPLSRLIEQLRQEYQLGPAPSAPEPPLPAEVQLEAIDIFLVDHDEELERLLSDALREEGFVIHPFHSLETVREELSRHLPRGLLTETRLADGTGFELIDELRGMEGGDEVVALVMSSETEFLDRVEAVRCGADGFFEKPLIVETLIRSLRLKLASRDEEPKRILSVEDDPDQASFVQMILESAGYVVRNCSNPKFFGADLTSFRPDLLLLDINLPEISGYELARYVRQNDAYATLPVIFLSTEGQLNKRIESIRAGADDHLLKPVSPPLLLSTVAARIERARFLQTLVDRDGLTGLLTHTAFLERLKQRFSIRSRSPRAAALVMLDLDHFKNVNDRYGHPVGDRVLSALAALMRRRLRLTDTVGRYGGEEFAILIDELNADEAMRLVERLLAEFNEQSHHAGDGTSFHVSFSAGISMLAPEASSVEEWKTEADRALYRAKERGRNRVER